MIDTIEATEIENPPGDTFKNNPEIQNHKMASIHLAAASAHYSAAGSYHKTGHHDKAEESIIAAQGSLHLAGEAQKELLKYYSLKS